MKKIILALIIVVIIAGGIWWWKSHRNLPVPGASQVGSAQYSCADGKTISAKYYDASSTVAESVEPGMPPVPTGSVSLVLSDGRRMVLSQTISASGIRYANADESLVFWSKGNGAFIVEQGTTTYDSCTSK